MYTRVPDRKSSHTEIKIPDNYSGNAFSNKEIYEEVKEPPAAPEKTEKAPPMQVNEIVEPTPTKIEARDKSMLSALFPSKSLKNHFPFGHGIGSEELLILGIMSLIFFSDEKEPDGELIMLLAILLFAG